MHNISLGPIDYLFTGNNSQPITFAFSFKTRIDHVHLQNSLDTTLEAFPVVRSQLHKVNDRELAFNIIDEGLNFSVHETDKTFNKDDHIENYIEPVWTTENQPLTRISITHTPEGTVVAVSISHALVDGFSYFHFLSSWARISRGDRILSPHIPRDMFSKFIQAGTNQITRDILYNDCGLFLDNRRTEKNSRDMTIEREYIQNDTIKSYIDEVHQIRNLVISENDVITAMLWKKYIPAWTAAGEDKKVYITCPFDFRRTLTGFPKNYFGCGLCFATAETTRNHLLNASIGDLALLIKKSISVVEDEYIKQSLSTIDSFRRQNDTVELERIHLRHPLTGMIVTNLTRLPIRDIDFGSGTPEDFLAFAEIEQGAAILPAKNGVEALVANPYKI